jgi:hypothetical protein
MCLGNHDRIHAPQWSMQFRMYVRSNHRKNEVNNRMKKFLLLFDIILVGNGLNQMI